MTHAAVGGHVLLLMWAHMHCAICSLRVHAVINVRGVHSLPLLMRLIYIKSFPICQSQTMASHGEEAQGVLFLFIPPPHIFIASWPPVLPYKQRHTQLHALYVEIIELLFRIIQWSLNITDITDCVSAAARLTRLHSSRDAQSFSRQSERKMRM